MKKILIIQNDDIVPVGVFGQALEDKGAQLTTRHAYRGELSELNSDDYDAAVILGGRTSAYDDDSAPFLADVVTLIQQFHQQKKPLFGICLGAQLLARSFGSAYRSNNGWEVAFTELEQSCDAASDPVFGSLPARYCMYEMHQDTLYLPDNATLLASSLQCKNQAFRIGKSSYAVQFHPEVTPEIVQGWAKRLSSTMDESQRGLLERMLDTRQEQYQEQEKWCHLLAEKWLELVSPR